MSSGTSFVFRPAIDDDQPVLLDFILTMARESEDRELDEDTVRQGIAAVFRRPEHGTYWLVENLLGDPVGSALVTTEWSDWNNAPYWWLQSVYLVPHARGQGVMGLLVKAIGKAAREEGAAELRLYVDEDNVRAIRAYEKCGFHLDHYRMMTRKLD